MRKAYLIVLSLLFFLQSVLAQQDNVKLISVDYQQAKIDQVVNDLESKTSYHFYYDPAKFDSLRVTVQATDKTLRAVLDLVFKNTSFHYAITAQQQV